MRFQDGLFCVTLFTLIFLKMKCGAAYYRLAVNRCPPARGLSAGRCLVPNCNVYSLQAAVGSSSSAPSQRGYEGDG